MAQIQPAEGVGSLGRGGSWLLRESVRESVRKSTLSGTHFLRLFLLTPAIIWAVSPARFLELHPSMFASPVQLNEALVGNDVMVFYLLLAIPALVLAHVL